MSISYTNLIYTAVNNALHGVPPEVSAAIDAVGIADTIFNEVAQSVSETAAADEYKRSLLTRTKSITLSSGLATLTDDVLTKFMPDAVLYDPTSATTLMKKYAWRLYPDFVRRGDKRLGVFSLQGGSTLVVIEPNANFTVPLTASGTRTLVIPCAVVKPAAATDDVDCPEEVISDLTEALSETLRGQIAKVAGAGAAT